MKEREATTERTEGKWKKHERKTEAEGGVRVRYSRGVRFVYLKKAYLVCSSAIEPGTCTLEPVVESKERALLWKNCHDDIKGKV